MFIDTNVLVYAQYEGARKCAVARELLREVDMRGEKLSISRQVLREYIATVTKTMPWSPRIPVIDALRQTDHFISVFNILEDGPNVYEMLSHLCNEVGVRGPNIHDTNIVATMLANGENTILTFNRKHYYPYNQFINLVDIDEYDNGQ